MVTGRFNVVPVPLRAQSLEAQAAYIESLNGAHANLVVRSGESTALVQALDFDTLCFGVPMGRAFGFSVAPPDAPSLAAAIIERAQAEGIAHLTARVPARDVFLIQALTSRGFFMTDTNVTLLNASFADAEPRADVEIGPVRPIEIETLARESEEIYAHGRFFHDPSLDPVRARRVYYQWIRNDCEGRADLVLVARVDGQPAGYIACLWEGTHAVIDLIAVFPNAQGKGIGSALIEAALAHYKDRTSRMYVGTQGGNRQATRLYGATGFRFEDLDMTLHWSSRLNLNEGSNIP